MAVSYEYFFNSPPAGFEDAWSMRTETNVGLGLGLPTDVMTTTATAHVGLGISIDPSYFLAEEESTLQSRAVVRRLGSA